MRSRPFTFVIWYLSLRAYIVSVMLFAFAGNVSSADEDRPNVVFLLSDDHAHDALSCAGHPVLKTPQLDRLAADGVRFTHCFVPNPICTPARAAIFTGQDNWTNGVYFFGLPINEDSPLWPKLLAEAGYDTFFTGKWHNTTAGRRSAASPTRPTCGSAASTTTRPCPSCSRASPRAHVSRSTSLPARRSLMRRSSSWTRGSGSKPHGRLLVKGESSGSPSALFVSFTAPHDPWIPPGEYATMYAPEEIPLPANFMPRPPFKFDESFPDLRDQRQVPFPAHERERPQPRCRSTTA